MKRAIANRIRNPTIFPTGAGNEKVQPKYRITAPKRYKPATLPMSARQPFPHFGSENSTIISHYIRLAIVRYQLLHLHQQPSSFLNQVIFFVTLFDLPRIKKAKKDESKG